MPDLPLHNEEDKMIDFRCRKCGAILASDEIALHRKLFSRAAVTYFCLDHQAEYLRVSRDDLEKLIEYYHRSGKCSLFAKWE